MEHLNHLQLKQEQKTFYRLKEAYPGARLLIVSNRAGTAGHLQETLDLEQTTGVKVLRHSTKKPGCSSQILDHFNRVPDASPLKPSEIAVIGDRLLTDVMLANILGACSFWIRDGVEVQNDPVSVPKTSASQTQVVMRAEGVLVIAGREKSPGNACHFGVQGTGTTDLSTQEPDDSSFPY